MSPVHSASADIKVLRTEQLSKCICVIVGTRPGIVKQSPLIRALANQGTPFFVVHTGQHYSPEMDAQFFTDLELPEAEFKLNNLSDCRSHGEQTAAMLKGVEAILMQTRPMLVLVGGDANTNLAAALAARKLHIAVGHVEAGLRSFDWRMPEEHNRVIIDHISEYLFAPTLNAQSNLEREGIRGQTFLVGNTIVDALRQHCSIADRKSRILDQLNVQSGRYLLLTVHREETTDQRESLLQLIRIIEAISAESRMPVIFPAHPRTRKRLQQFGLYEDLSNANNLRLIEPLGYLDFVRLLGSAAVMLTDSGGVQQEACILDVPCVTLRENTEWVETLEIGANVLSGLDPSKAAQAVRAMLSSKRRWRQPFGNGDTGEQIARIAANALETGVYTPPTAPDFACREEATV